MFRQDEGTVRKWETWTESGGSLAGALMMYGQSCKNLGLESWMVKEPAEGPGKWLRW